MTGLLLEQPLVHGYGWGLINYQENQMAGISCDFISVCKNDGEEGPGCTLKECCIGGFLDYLKPALAFK